MFRVLVKSNISAYNLMYKKPWHLYFLRPSLPNIPKKKYSVAPPFLPPPQDSKKIVKFLRKDRIPEGYELVYQTPLLWYLGFAQMASLFAGVSSLALAYPFYQTRNEPKETPITIPEELFKLGPQTDMEVAVSAVSLAIACISLQYVCFKIPLRIYSNKKTFIMVKSHFLLGPWGPGKKMEFIAGSAKQAKPSRFTQWNSVRYVIGNKTYFIFEEYFRTSYDFLSMTGQK